MTRRDVTECEIDDQRPCSLCGQSSWTGVWFGGGDAVRVCPTCATDTLPALAADALPMADLGRINDALTRIERAYWRAIALRVMHERTRR